MSKAFFSILFCLLFLNNIFSQDDIIKNSKYRVSFKNKDNNQCSLSNPSAFLSQKALLRRQRNNIDLTFNDLPITSEYLQALKTIGVNIINKSKWFNSVIIKNVDSSSYKDILALPYVLKIEKVATVNIIKSNSNIFSQLSNKSNEFTSSNVIYNRNNQISDQAAEYGYSFEQVDMINCNFIHTMGYKGKGITIAVLDAGFYNVNKLHVFDSLWLNNRIKGTYDFVNPGGDVFRQAWHGMMVLSIIGGNVPFTYMGTAPEADYWLLRTEDANSENVIEEDNWAAGAEFADSVGADVINSSLGYTVFEDTYQNHTYNDMNGKTTRVSRAAAIASSKGIIVVSSAGNEGSSSWKYISAPADADSILTVGAVDINRKYAKFSSVGTTSDGRVKPDVVALGQGTAVCSTSGEIMNGNGTSFSSPVIAGAVASLLQSLPKLGYYYIINSIKESANIFKSPDSFTGYGIPNFASVYLKLSDKPLYVNQSNSCFVSPNPFIDNLKITLLSEDNSTVNIDFYDLTGKVIYSRTGFKKKMGYNYFYINNLEAISNGIYFIKISSDTIIYKKKIIKVK